MGILDSLFGGNKETAAAPAPAAPASNGGDSAWDTISGEVRMACPVAPIEEDAATGEIAEIYDSVKKAMQVPTVPNIDKILANSPPALKGFITSDASSTCCPRPVCSRCQ